MTLDDLTPYTLPVEPADWDSLLIEWAPLIPAGSSRWLLSRFGELFLEHADGKIGMLQVSAFRYEVVARQAEGVRASRRGQVLHFAIEGTGPAGRLRRWRGS